MANYRWRSVSAGQHFLLGVIWGGPFVAILQRLKLGKQIRAELMDSHHVQKVGTPTMGGIMIIMPTMAITLALNISRIVEEGAGAQHSACRSFVLIGFALLGVIDDWEGIQTSRGNVGEGLSGTMKFAAQILLALIASIVISHFEFSYANSMILPLASDWHSPESSAICLHQHLHHRGQSSNATNFTDGLGRSGRHHYRQRLWRLWHHRTTAQSDLSGGVMLCHRRRLLLLPVV